MDHKRRTELERQYWQAEARLRELIAARGQGEPTEEEAALLLAQDAIEWEFGRADRMLQIDETAN
jgi:hypothetical protein